MLAAPQGAEPAEPNAAAPPARPVDAASLVGDWKARQPDGSTVALRLTSNSTYTWRFTRQGKTQDHSGTYALADNLLILKEGNTPAMVGQRGIAGRQPPELQACQRQSQRSGTNFQPLTSASHRRAAVLAYQPVEKGGLAPN